MSIRTAARAARPRRRSRGGTALAASGSALAVSLLLAGCASTPDDLASADAAGVDGPVVATSVLGVAEGQPAYWSGYEDGARFADRIPYFAFVQTRWLEGERGPANGPVLRPFLADGTEVDIIQRQVGGVSASAQCPYEMPVLRADDGHAAEEHLECVVYAVPVGQELAELRWHDVPRTVLETPDPATHPFLAAPVVWEVDALPAAAAEAEG